MDLRTFLQLSIFSIPEALVITWLSSGLMGVKTTINKVLKIGILMGILSFFLRFLTSTYIINVISYIGLLIILFSIFYGNVIWERIAAVILSVSIYLIIEFLNIKTIEIILNVNPVVILDNLLLRVCCFIPQLITAIFIAFFINRCDFSLFVNYRNNYGQEQDYDR